MTLTLDEPNIGTLLESAAEKYEDKTVLIVDHEEISYSFRELDDKVNQFANALRQQGIERGHHVAVMLPNCSEFPFTWLALAKLGAVMIPVNTRYKIADLEYILNDSDATALVIHTDYLDVFSKIPKERYQIEKIFQVGESEIEFGIDLSSLADKMPSKEVQTNLKIDDVMNLQYTSGTTGFPKGAITTHEYWLLLGERAAIDMEESDLFFSMSPFYYMDPQWELLMSLYAGCGMVLADKLTMDNFAKCVKKYPVTHFWAWERMLYLSEFEHDKDHHLRFALLSGFTPRLHKALEEMFHVVAREAYGMTEIGGCLRVPPEDTHMVGSGSVGMPVDLREVRIVDDSGNDVALGETGELLVKGPGIFKGYYKKPEANAEAFDGEYFRTGDLFYQDEAGNYYFVSRKKEMIRRMGDNISATEVEHFLMSHPMISGAAVVPVPDEIRHEEVKAYILPAVGETPETIPPEEIVEYCLERIAKFKVPRYIEYVTEFSRTASGKIQKFKLIAEKEDLTEGIFDRFAKANN
jgi:crotonobetaine/carnitine-CoA ligase